MTQLEEGSKLDNVLLDLDETTPDSGRFFAPSDNTVTGKTVHLTRDRAKKNNFCLICAQENKIKNPATRVANHATELWALSTTSNEDI